MTTPPATPSPPRLAFGVACLLALLTLAVFLPALGHEFINMDDGDYVTENPMVRRGLTWRGAGWALTTFHAANWHPVTWLSHQLDVTLFGLQPWGHHLTSVLFHAANVLLLFLLLRAMSGALWRSAVAAALFAAHPLRVESVAWVAERKDVLSMFLFLLTLVAYNRFVRRRSPGRYAAVIVCFALGLMAKPMLVTAPILLLLLDAWPLGRLHRFFPGAGPGDRAGLARTAAPLLFEKAPLFALSLISGLLTIAAQSSRGAVASLGYFPLEMRLGNAAASLVGYLEKTVWPRDLVVFYIHPGAIPGWRLAISLAVLAGITFLCITLARRRPYLPCGWAWYLVTLLPVLGILQVGEQGMADRYTYLPHVGLLLGFVWLAADAVGGRDGGRGRGRLVPTCAAILAVLALAVLARRQLSHWENSLALMRHTIRVHPNTWWAYNNLGTILAQEGRPEEGLKKLDMALRIRPDFEMAYYNKGLILHAQGKAPEAIAMFREALRIRPGYAEAEINLGLALVAGNRTAEAIEHYRRALAVEPANLQALANLGNALAQVGNVDEALIAYNKALEADDGIAELHYNLGTILAAENDYPGAAAAFRKAVAIDPRYAEAHNNLGAALMMLGELREAREQILTALRLNPDYPSARTNLERLETRGSAEHMP